MRVVAQQSDTDNEAAESTKTIGEVVSEGVREVLDAVSETLGQLINPAPPLVPVRQRGPRVRRAPRRDRRFD